MIHFIIGTEAELIKTFPIMLELKKRKIKYQVIATGQHPIYQSKLLDLFNLQKPKTVLYTGPSFTSFPKMIFWASKILLHSRGFLNKIFLNDKKGIVLVQGDTVSAAIGALLAKRMGLRLAHVEAGMWSGNLLNPFPEEVDRRIISYFSEINFPPADLGFNNLKKYKNKIVIHTHQNTHSTVFDFSIISFTSFSTKF